MSKMDEVNLSWSHKVMCENQCYSMHILLAFLYFDSSEEWLTVGSFQEFYAIWLIQK